MLKPDYEQILINNENYDLVVGIDEVGRGPWAGPMYMCSFVYKSNYPIILDVNDSKKLSIKKRQRVFSELKNFEHELVIMQAEEIDKIGLGPAVSNSLIKLISNVSQRYPQKRIKFLVDGYMTIESESFDIEFVKKGDGKYYSIAAASVIAKVERDNAMINLGKQYPAYGFEKHVGYGTKNHQLALEQFGPIQKIHRFSFAPIKKYKILNK